MDFTESFLLKSIYMYECYQYMTVNFRYYKLDSFLFPTVGLHWRDVLVEPGKEQVFRSNTWARVVPWRTKRTSTLDLGYGR